MQAWSLNPMTLFLLIDPMIGPKASMPPFAFIRSRPQKNPTVEMPQGAAELVARATHCLITHQHPDHLDKEAIQMLKAKQIPSACSFKDAADLRKKGIKVVQEIDYWQRGDFLGGKIEGIPARHGYGFVAKPAGHVMGYFIQLPGEPSIYLSSDTIYTEDVKKALIDYQPEINVVAAGGARFDFFQPLLMRVEDVIRFIKDAPGKVIANHMEAVNHCPTTRAMLSQLLSQEGLSDKVWIPQDGDSKQFE